MLTIVSKVVAVENSFNTIYRVQRGRPWTRRVPMYWFMLTVSPLVLAEFNVKPADIAVRPEDGVMHGLGHSGIPEYTYGLYRIDPSTAAVSHVGPSLGRPGGVAFTVVPEPTALSATLMMVALLTIFRP